MKCTNEKCGYTWKTKITKPKLCPKCKQFINYNIAVDRLVFDEQEINELIQKRIFEIKDQITGKKYLTTIRTVD